MDYPTATETDVVRELARRWLDTCAPKDPSDPIDPYIALDWANELGPEFSQTLYHFGVAVSKAARISHRGGGDDTA